LDRLKKGKAYRMYSRGVYSGSMLVTRLTVHVYIGMPRGIVSSGF